MTVDIEIRQLQAPRKRTFTNTFGVSNSVISRKAPHMTSPCDFAGASSGTTTSRDFLRFFEDLHEHNVVEVDMVKP